MKTNNFSTEIPQMAQRPAAGQSETALEVSTRALDMLEILNQLLDQPTVYTEEEKA